MISKNVKKLCCEDISLIENYDKAKEQWSNGNASPPPNHKGMHWKLVDGKRTYFN